MSKIVNLIWLYVLLVLLLLPPLKKKDNSLNARILLSCTYSMISLGAWLNNKRFHFSEGLIIIEIK